VYQVLIRVRHKMCKEHYVIICLKPVIKLQRMHFFELVILDVRSPIRKPISIKSHFVKSANVAVCKKIYVFAATMPAFVLRLAKMHRVNKWLHAFSVETVWLRKVNNIYSNPGIGFNVHNRKKVPLVCSAVRLRVVLQVKVVFAVRSCRFWFFILLLMLEFSP